ncbi:MAG: hypothetical protein IMHGJWDQ_000293 [Candidatus Fervidibacter sp.]
MFPIAAALHLNATLAEVERAVEHWLDTVVVPIDQNNWKRVREMMTSAHKRGWDIRFVLWAKGATVKSIPLHRFANHPALAGWLLQDISDPVLIAMVRATTEEGMAWAWQTPLPFTKGTLALQPMEGSWWAWISVKQPETLHQQVTQALLSGTRGICFSRLPDESNPSEKECLKAIAFFAVHLRLWQPFLANLPPEGSHWEWQAGDFIGRVWELGEREWLCLLVAKRTMSRTTIHLPFVVPERIRAYGVQFPALLRLPLQRKGDGTLIHLTESVPLTFLWLTDNKEKVQRAHQHTNELLPKAMQFAVQWALVRKERWEQEKRPLPDLGERWWTMLQQAKRRQLAPAYQTAIQLLSALSALP